MAWWVTRCWCVWAAAWRPPPWRCPTRPIATRGAAQALRLGDEIGSLQPGAMADLCLWDYAVGAVAQRRDALARDALTRDAMGRHLHERLMAWVTLADDRNLVETWGGGVCRFSRCGGSSTSASAPVPVPVPQP